MIQDDSLQNEQLGDARQQEVLEMVNLQQENQIFLADTLYI